VPGPGVFEGHLREAIALNRARAPVYARLSQGRSRVVSEALILAERATLPLARWYDTRARPYHDAGVPLMPSMFVSMEGLPEPGMTSIHEARMNAMRRHLEESRERVRAVTPRLRHLATSKGLPDPEQLLRKLVWWHDRALPLADRLDALARPLQREGISILVHDLPPIPLLPADWPDERPRPVAR